MAKFILVAALLLTGCSQSIPPSIERSNAKWAAIEAAGWCPLRTSTFPRPKPGCKPLPPGGIREIEYQMSSNMQTMRLHKSIRVGQWQNHFEAVNNNPWRTYRTFKGIRY